jgi:hypothetical protein
VAVRYIFAAATSLLLSWRWKNIHYRCWSTWLVCGCLLSLFMVCFPFLHSITVIKNLFKSPQVWHSQRCILKLISMGGIRGQCRPDLLKKIWNYFPNIIWGVFFWCVLKTKYVWINSWSTQRILCIRRHCLLHI